MKNTILNLLKNTEDFISGQHISEKLKVSRTAVWKYINMLKEEGYLIESVSKKGYKLLKSPDILTENEIMPYLNTKYIGNKIIHFHTINSTNTKAKELASLGEENGTIILSEEQTLGKGRLGRQWCSPKGKGIWLSLILKPDLDPINASKITQIGAAALCKSFIEIGIPSFIKWPNDIVINNRKVCGILTEMNGELNRINYIILGIGINVNIDMDDLPEELKDTASSLKIESGKTIDRRKLVALILNNFEPLYNELLNQGHINSSIDICRKNSILLNKQIRIINKNSTKIAKALDLDNEGRLIVQLEDGTIDTIISGEVSIRGLYGYV